MTLWKAHKTWLQNFIFFLRGSLSNRDCPEDTERECDYFHWCIQETWLDPDGSVGKEGLAGLDDSHCLTGGQRSHAERSRGQTGWYRATSIKSGLNGSLAHHIIKRKGFHETSKDPRGVRLEINLAGGKETVTPPTAVGRDTVIRAGALGWYFVTQNQACWTDCQCPHLPLESPSTTPGRTARPWKIF